jgi:hypothetical protein
LSSTAWRSNAQAFFILFKEVDPAGVGIHSAIAQAAGVTMFPTTVQFTDFSIRMFQVNFSEQSMHELNQLDTRSQMLLVEVVSTLKQEQLDNPNEELGRFHRNGRDLLPSAGG